MQFKIHATEGVLFAANVLMSQLWELGHEAEIVSTVNLADETIYIIYCAGTLTHLPKNYIVYQTEYSNSKWFNPRYFEILKGAICIWEHSANNVIVYKRFNPKIAIVSAGIVREKVAPVKDILVLFYGYLIGSDRRRIILDNTIHELNRKNINVKVETNLFGNAIWDILKRTKVVVNIHYYPGNTIEQFRINEALSFGCHVVSEKSVFGDEKYKHSILFHDNLAEGVIHMLKQPFNYGCLARFDNFEEVKDGLKFVL